MQYQVPVSNSQPLRAALQVLLCFCILLDTLRVVARGGYSCCSSSLTSPFCHCSSLATSCSHSQIMLLLEAWLLPLVFVISDSATTWHLTPGYPPPSPVMSAVLGSSSCSSCVPPQPITSLLYHCASCLNHLTLVEEL